MKKGLNHIDDHPQAPSTFPDNASLATLLLTLRCFPKQIRQTAANLGYRLVMWTIDTLDWQTNSMPERIMQIISDHLTPGAIILMHAGSVSESQARDRVITLVQENLRSHV